MSEQLIKNIKLDKNFVKEIMGAHGELQAMTLIQRCVGTDMNPNIKDKTLRLMIWQMLHSIEVLESNTKTTYRDLKTINVLAESTNDQNTKTISHHILGLMDNIVAYVK